MAIKNYAAMLILGVSVSMSGQSLAQEYPSGPITIVVPWAPGSTGDVIQRFLAEALEPEIGQRVLLENRAGAGGNIGTAYVADSEPDGYTLVLGPNNVFTLNQYLYDDLGYDPTTDLIPITPTHYSPYVLYVNDQTPARTIEELVAYANETDGPLFFASSGLGTAGHMAAIRFTQLTGIDTQIVPYGSSSNSVNALLQNEVQAYVASAAVGRSQVDAGNLHVVAIAGPAISAYPDAPSSADAGLPEFQMGNWWAVAAPAGTPDEVVDTLYDLLSTAIASDSLQEQIRNLGALPGGTPMDEFAQEIRDESAFWEQMIAENGTGSD